MPSILLVGLGRVGIRTYRYLRELLPGARFMIVDVDKRKLEALKNHEEAELYVYEPGILPRLSEKADVAVTALPSPVAFRTILELSGHCVNIVDVSFFPQDPYVLEKIVEDCRSTLITDAGFAPGYSNIVAGYAYHKYNLDEYIEIAVGGIPDKPVPPIGYTVTWNPRDLLEEYTRPARYVENHEIKVAKPLELVKTIEIPGLGLFEGFISDGLRTMLRNIKAKNMREYTIRWPGHINAIKILYELGFLDSLEINMNGVKVKPIEFTARLLEEKLNLKTNDLAILRIEAFDQSFRVYRELAFLRGTPEDPATPVFTALIHAYTTRILLEKKLKHGVVSPENLYEFKEEYEEYLVKHGAVVKKELKH
ncbi:MAG: saccharopine dehydrogenase C-terminal domain-containing protein [Desulfurococcaceae archaeon]